MQVILTDTVPRKYWYQAEILFNKICSQSEISATPKKSLK